MNNMVQTDPVHGSEAARWGGWTWREPMRGEHFRRCSYCGSMHPEDLAAEPEWRAEWADRKYGFPHKFYVDIPNRDPEALFAIGSTSGGIPRYGSLGDGGLTWIGRADLTAEQRAIAERDGHDREPYPTFVGFGTRESHFGKFYTVHLADPAVSSETKAVIERRSGLRFHFDGGRVSWEPCA